MKTVGLISGGKDSIFNLLLCKNLNHEIVALANLQPPDSIIELDSFMYQSVGSVLISAVAESMKIPLFTIQLQGHPKSVQTLHYKKTVGDEVEDLYELLSKVKCEHPTIEGVACGAILSNYQRLRVEDVCGRLNLKVLAFLWKLPQRYVLNEMIEAKINAIIIKTASIGLSKMHLGKSICELKEYFNKLQLDYGFHVCGEGGEYESFTLDCPLYTKKILIDERQCITTLEDDYAPVCIFQPLAWHAEKKVSSNDEDESVTLWKKSEMKASEGEDTRGNYGHLLRTLIFYLIDLPANPFACIRFYRVNHELTFNTNKDLEDSYPCSKEALFAADKLCNAMRQSRSDAEDSPGNCERKEVEIGAENQLAAAIPPEGDRSFHFFPLLPSVEKKANLETDLDSKQNLVVTQKSYYVLNIDSCAVEENDLNAALEDVIKKLREFLKEVNLTLANIVNYIAQLSDIKHFSAFNAKFSELFSEDPTLPCGLCFESSLPSDTALRLSVFIYNSELNYSLSNEIKTVRVASMSSWGCACIGAYSQALTVSNFFVYLSGILGLIPHSLETPNEESTRVCLNELELLREELSSCFPSFSISEESDFFFPLDFIRNRNLLDQKERVIEKKKISYLQLCTAILEINLAFRSLRNILIEAGSSIFSMPFLCILVNRERRALLEDTNYFYLSFSNIREHLVYLFHCEIFGINKKISELEKIRKEKRFKLCNSNDEGKADKNEYDEEKLKTQLEKATKRKKDDEIYANKINSVSNELSSFILYPFATIITYVEISRLPNNCLIELYPFSIKESKDDNNSFSSSHCLSNTSSRESQNELFSSTSKNDFLLFPSTALFSFLSKKHNYQSWCFYEYIYKRNFLNSEELKKSNNSVAKSLILHHPLFLKQYNFFSNAFSTFTKFHVSFVSNIAVDIEEMLKKKVEKKLKQEAKQVIENSADAFRDISSERLLKSGVERSNLKNQDDFVFDPSMFSDIVEGHDEIQFIVKKKCNSHLPLRFGKKLHKREENVFYSACNEEANISRGENNSNNNNIEPVNNLETEKEIKSTNNKSFCAGSIILINNNHNHNSLLCKLPSNFCCLDSSSNHEPFNFCLVSFRRSLKGLVSCLLDILLSYFYCRHGSVCPVDSEFNEQEQCQLRICTTLYVYFLSEYFLELSNFSKTSIIRDKKSALWFQKNSAPAEKCARATDDGAHLKNKTIGKEQQIVVTVSNDKTNAPKIGNNEETREEERKENEQGVTFQLECEFEKELRKQVKNEHEMLLKQLKSKIASGKNSEYHAIKTKSRLVEAILQDKKIFNVVYIPSSKLLNNSHLQVSFFSALMHN